MTGSDLRTRVLAISLAALAGYVDAFGFLSTGGFFVSFMSGNSTRVGISLAQGSRDGLIAAGLVGAFLAGVVAGALAGHVAKPRQRPCVLALVSVLLAAAAILGALGLVPAAVAAMAVATGVENNTFQKAGEVSIGLTYMTGGLVKLGQRIATALLTADRFGWVPNLLLWAGFVSGVAGGALTYPRLGFSGLWGAVALAAALARATWAGEADPAG